MSGPRPAAGLLRGHCRVLQVLCSALICGQAPAVLRKPFLLGLRQFSARRSAPMAGRAASEHPHQCQLAPVCCTAVQFLEQLACGPTGRGSVEYAACGPFSDAAA